MRKWLLLLFDVNICHYWVDVSWRQIFAQYKEEFSTEHSKDAVELLGEISKFSVIIERDKQSKDDQPSGMQCTLHFARHLYGLLYH